MRKSKGVVQEEKPRVVVFEDKGHNAWKAVIRGVVLSDAERHYVLCLRAGQDDGFPPEQAIKLNESISRKCSEASVSFSALLQVMGCGDLEMAACLARGIRFGDDRDKAFFARLILDREKGTGKKRPKGAGPSSPRPSGTATAKALAGSEDEPALPPLPTATD